MIILMSIIGYNFKKRSREPVQVGRSIYERRFCIGDLGDILFSELEGGDK